METNDLGNYLKEILNNMPNDWLNLTTHRLDIYNESLAKTQFIEQFELLFKANNFDQQALNDLPTAYDYIRLGHPLSCILEWTIAKFHHIHPENVISFTSRTAPILAILRKNLFLNKNTRIVYTDTLPEFFNTEIIRHVYGYTFELKKIEQISELNHFDGSTIFVSISDNIAEFEKHPNVDFAVSFYENLGSIIMINGKTNESYTSEIQHVRRRETIAMTPNNCLIALQSLIDHEPFEFEKTNFELNKKQVIKTLQDITDSDSKALVASSGLSMQYAIMMGLIDDALQNHKGKNIKFIVPPNCYGGTNDQARRVAASLDHVDIVDLLVDGTNNMVQSIDTVLDKIAEDDAIPYIIAEIPTNPRVEVPDLNQLKTVLSKKRITAKGKVAVDPVFILDQTFCPNVHFLGKNAILSDIRSISYASGSKFPSGGLCTAGYCIGNKKTTGLMEKIEQHLNICDNEATALQYKVLAQQLPSMKQRIKDAYKNTNEFVHFIHEVLPEAKINFVSDALARQDFTPSVFSLDLPTKGNTDEEKEAHKRALNLKLINMMITEIPDESKFCVSYGQLKGCYWTIPATSTQGTTKEGDKDYIVRVAVSPNLDLDRHKRVFLDFVKSIN